jgi:hypothetical protein
LVTGKKIGIFIYRMKKLACTFSLALLFASILFLAGCDVEESPAKALGPFDRIQSNGTVTFRLVTGADNRVLSTTMMESMYNAGGGTLTVNGSGSMTIAIKDIKMLWCNACTVENPEPLIADTLNMSIHAGSATLEGIQINGYLGLSAVNTGTYEFSGYSHFFNVSSINLVSIEASNLVTDSTYVNSTAVSDTKVHATKCVNVFINSIGNVRYRGNPPIVRLSRTGSGELIKE